jgi:hypothetical protein
VIKDIILGWLECFGKKYFVVGYVLEAPQNKSQKLFWGVTLVILPRVARMVLPILMKSEILHLFWYSVKNVGKFPNPMTS